MSRTVFCVFLFAISILSIGQCFKIQPRILYGKSSERGQFPFYALLKVLVNRPGSDPIEGICGGTLLNNQFVLTSAHCVDVAAIQLDLGSWRMNDTSEKGRKSYSVGKDQIYIHPEFNVNKFKHDLALIKLEEPVEFSDVIQPVSFPTECSIRDEISYTAIGNGYIINGFFELPEILQYNTLNLTSNGVCLQVFNDMDEENQFCAGGFKDTAFCTGDIGGPLIYRSENTLYGVSTAFYRYACDVGPGLFTSVFNYLPWISQITGMELPKC